MDIDYSLALSFSKLAIDVFLKCTVLLVGVWFTVKLLRHHSASVHSLTLTVVIAGLVLLPALSTLAPVWRVPLLPDPASASAPGPVQADTGHETPQFGSPGKPQPATMAPVPAPGPRWPVWILLGWLAGAAGCLLWLLSGEVGLRWVLRKAAPLQGEPWQKVLKDVCEEINVDCEVQLFQCPPDRHRANQGYLTSQGDPPCNRQEMERATAAIGALARTGPHQTEGQSGGDPGVDNLSALLVQPISVANCAADEGGT